MPSSFWFDFAALVQDAIDGGDADACFSGDVYKPDPILWRSIHIRGYEG
jgi:hypothetical protein